MKRLLIGIASVALVSAACGADTQHTTSQGAQAARHLEATHVATVRPPVRFDFQDLAIGTRAFGFALGNKLTASNGNLVYSPVSLALAFAMAREGAQGKTAADIDRVLHFPANRTAAYNALITSLNYHDPDTTVQIGDGLFVDPSLAVKQQFLTAIKKWYGAGIYQTPFPDPALHDINAYVDNQTHGRIPHLLSDLPAGTLAALINTVYLDASWFNAFQKSATRDAPFTTGTGQRVTVPMMNQELEADYADGPGWEAVRVPFYSRLSMEILLPNGSAAPMTLLSPNVLDAADQGFHDTAVTLSLPRWKIDSRLELTKVLAAMGMRHVFGAQGDFSGITSPSLQLVEALQQANIDVDEKGVVASAASALMFAGSAHEVVGHVRVNVDHAFAFAIMDNRSGTPLFEGTVSDPGQGS